MAPLPTWPAAAGVASVAAAGAEAEVAADSLMTAIVWAAKLELTASSRNFLAGLPGDLPGHVTACKGTHMRLALAAAMALMASPAYAQEQRSFPAGDQGASVSYVESGGDHPTVCVATVTAGLPDIAISVNMYSNNFASVTVGSQRRSFPVIKAGTNAGLQVGSDYFFGTVYSDQVAGAFHVVTINLIQGPYGQPIDGAFRIINRVVYGSNRVAVVADDAPIAAGSIPEEPGIGDALSACQQYLLSRAKHR